MRQPYVSVGAVALFALACSSQPSRGGAAVDAAATDLQTSEVIVDQAVAPDASSARPMDAFVAPDLRVPPPDFGPVPVAVPLPATGPTPQRLLSGKDDRLTGSGSSSCSHQEPASASGDRWCSFTRPGPTPENAELWVVNMTKTAAGKAPPCDGTSPDCLRMTRTLWTSSALGGPSHPYSHEFHGDTLVFYADATSPPLELHRGPVYAWRPGWPGPRKLTTDQGLMCFGHPLKAIAHCLDDVTGNPNKPDNFELRAGSIETPPTAPLPSLGRIRPTLTNGQVGWRAQYTPDGAFFVFSQPDPDPAVETLRAIATQDLGRMAPRVVRNAVTGWSIANDSKRIYFMRSSADQEYDLFAADLAEGAAEAKLGTRVTNYLILGEGTTDEGISFLVNSGSDRGAFRVARDSRMPDSAKTIFNYRGLLEDVHMSGDFRYTAWLDAGFNARVVRSTDINSCKLNTHTDSAIFEPLFLESAGLVFFSQDNADDPNDRDGLIARPDDCKGIQRFALKIDLYLPIGDRGLVYADDRTPNNQVSLKYVKAIREGTEWRLDTPVLIRERIDMSGFTVLGKDPKHVIFQSSSGDGAGTFVFGPLPL